MISTNVTQEIATYVENSPVTHQQVNRDANTDTHSKVLHEDAHGSGIRSESDANNYALGKSGLLHEKNITIYYAFYWY